MKPPTKALAQPKRKEAPMRRLFGNRPSLHAALLLALAAAFLLIPAAAANAEVGDLEVTISGSGDGTVTSNEGVGGEVPEPIPPINCEWNAATEEQSGTCIAEAQNPEGAYIGALFAEPGENSEFVEWKLTKAFKSPEPGVCEEFQQCEVFEFEEIKLEAVFKSTLNTHVTIEGAGSGSVLGVSPNTGEPPIECHWNGTTEEQTGTCDAAASEPFPELFTVVLEAVPAPGSVFTGWTVEEGTVPPEACEKLNAEECTIFLPTGGEIKVKASFACEGTPPCPPPKGPPLKVLKDGNGEGTVTSVQSGENGEQIECGSHCEEEFAEGEVVELEASEATGSEFTGWTEVSGEPGTCTGTTSPCELTMGEAKEIEATFSLIPHTLTVVPTGEGSVSAEEPPVPVSGEISGCEEAGGSCSAVYGEGQTVTLVATPGEHKETVWTSGCTSVSGDTCEVAIPAGDATVEVEFVTAPQGTLTVEPTGEGSVDALEPPEPASGEILACEEGGGAECSAVYYQGETVTLEATPGLHKETAWTSGCDNVVGDTCEVAVDEENVSVEVEFAQITHTLTITESGTGSGAVECNIEGGGFGSCAGPIDEGASVEVKATPAAHSTFDGFSAGTNSASGCEAEGSPCSFNLEEDSALTATFTQITHELTVVPTGEGAVDADSGAIAGCEAGGGTCVGTYDEGSTVTLEATPGLHKETVWTSGCDNVPSANECEVEILGDATVEVEFVQITHTLGVAVVGTGEVECKVEGGSAEACAAEYAEGTELELIATPGTHFSFSGWTEGSGSIACTGTANCGPFTLEEDSAVKATFSQITHTLTVNTAGAGSGSVSCDGGSCASSYPEGTSVTLTATAASGSTFAGWSGGGCSGSGNCVVTINADTTVTATFDAESSGGGGGGGGADESCLTNAGLCKPGFLIANPAAWVKGNKALLKVRCRGEQGARCRGVLKLIARVRVHGKKRNVLVGRSKYNLPTNSAVRILRAKLTRGGLRLVRRAGKRGLKVKLIGKNARNRVVKLKQRGGGKKRNKRRARR
jgi:hypothetical protein